MARVPYLRREDADESQKPLYDRLEAERKVPTANIFLALTNAPTQLDAFLTYANSLRAADLSPRLRELAILTVGYATRSAYEVAHHQSHGLKAGLTEEQLAAVADFESSGLFDDTEKAVMRLAQESTLQVDVSEETWRAAMRPPDGQADGRTVVVHRLVQLRRPHHGIAGHRPRGQLPEPFPQFVSS